MSIFSKADLFYYWKRHCVVNDIPINSNDSGLYFNMVYLHMVFDGDFRCEDERFHIGLTYDGVDVDTTMCWSKKTHNVVNHYVKTIHNNATMLYVLEYLKINHPNQLYFNINDLMKLKDDIWFLSLYKDDFTIWHEIKEYCIKFGCFMNDYYVGR